MFDTSLLERGTNNTSFGGNFPDSNTANPNGSLNPAADRLFMSAAHKELALSSGFDVNYSLSQTSQAAVASKDLSGTVATELFLFTQQENLPLHAASSTSRSVAASNKVLTGVAKGDCLTGISDNHALVGSLSSNVFTSNNRWESLNSNRSVSATSSTTPTPDLAGNTTTTARNISVGSSVSTYSDFVGSTDPNDYYRFSLSNTNNLSVTLNGLSGDADIQLLDSTGTSVLQGSYNGGTLADSITRQLTAGTYFLRVSPYGGANTNYNLNVSATPVAPQDLAGNTIATARNISVGSSSSTYSDFVGSADTSDYYRFSLSNTNNLSVTLNGLSGDADIQLLDSTGTSVLQGSYNGGTLAESINRQLTAGNYFLRVCPYGGANTNYNLNVSATPVVPQDLAGNTIATARNITVGSSPSIYSDFVGNADTNDYYRFTLSNTSNLSVTLNGLNGNADVQLLNSTGTSVLQGSYNGGTFADSITRQLTAGTYFLRVFPTSGVNTNYNLSVSATSIATTDWYSQNLRDSGIINLTRSLAADGQLSRNDMIAIFRDAKDGNVIDAAELTDLRTIVSNASRFNIADYVRVLSDKVVNGSVANQRFQGGSLGNLYAGSSATQMENLIGKWFLGSDRPTADSGTTYRLASGSLFQNGISYQDIKQGDIGDCYYLAALAGTAFRSPSTIQNMFIDNGDNTYTVRFFNQGVAEYVTVDKYLPTDSLGRFVNANVGNSYNNSSNELWVALAEKAYAQLNESGWIGQDHTNSYQGIEGGMTEQAAKQITGHTTSVLYSLDNNNFNAILNAFNAGRTVFLGGYPDPSDSESRHAYTMVGYNSSNGQFAIYNPWGRLEYYTWAQMTQGIGGRPAKFFDWSYTTA